MRSQNVHGLDVEEELANILIEEIDKEMRASNGGMNLDELLIKQMLESAR